MTNGEAGRAAQGEPLDFDRADFRDDAPAARCAHCGAGLGDRYFAIGTVLLCGGCSEAIGDWIERGHRYGLIRFGSRTDVWLPADAELCVRKGDPVRGGSTVAARLAAAGAGGGAS